VNQKNRNFPARREAPRMQEKDFLGLFCRAEWGMPRCKLALLGGSIRRFSGGVEKAYIARYFRYDTLLSYL